MTRLLSDKQWPSSLGGKHRKKNELCKSDHVTVEMLIDFDRFTRGPGVWRHPDYLLKDLAYVTAINTTISASLARNVINDDGTTRFMDNQANGYVDFLRLSPEEKQKQRYAVSPQYLLQ